VVSQWTRIPLIRLEQKESERLLKMEDEMKRSIVGQDEAVSAISVPCAVHGLVSRILAVLSVHLFSWDLPGVGKTLLARILSEFMFVIRML